MKTKLFFNLILFVVLILPSLVAAQTTEFTYQGKLTDGGMTPTGNYDFELRLYDAATGGTLLGTQTRLGVSVSNGIFTLSVDFGAQFSGAARFLEIAVRPAGSSGGYQQVLPRQPITSTPYAIRALSATNSTQLGGITVGGFVQNTTAPQTASFNVTGNGTVGGNLTVNGTLNADLPAGDSSYVQNRTTQQPGTTNFNVSGDGTISGTLTATTVNGNTFSGLSMNSGVYRIGGENVLKNFGTRNIFVGNNSGGNGTDNSFFGYNAGNTNLATGIDNSFFGSDAGGANTSGTDNSFFGSDAGDSNTTGTNNTIIGSSADVASNNLQFATAIGAGAVVNQSNTIQIGRGTNPLIDIVRIPVLKIKFAPLGTTDMCLAAADADGYGSIGNCSSSIRFKSNVQTYTRGLDLVRSLRPVTFNWRNGGKADVGFIAEEIEEIEPLLATYNENNEIQGVKYKQISVLLVNAVNEQQMQIEAQEKQLQQQQLVIDGLKKLVCSQSPNAKMCKEEQK